MKKAVVSFVNILTIRRLCRSNVIVGFPQETEEEFETTYDFVKRIHFYEMHVFKYSRRKGTVADKLTVRSMKRSRHSEVDAF